MLRFTINNNTDLTQDELMAMFRNCLGVPLDPVSKKPLIRISPRSNENSIAITLGRKRGITRDLFLNADLTSARKASLTFTDAAPEPDEPVNNDENTVVDANGNPV